MCPRAFGAVRVSQPSNSATGCTTTPTASIRRGASGDPACRPEPGRQYRIERELMRNEYASMPFLAPIAPMIPRTLAADFTHEIIGRDYLFQTMLDGVPAPDGLGAYPRSAWTPFFRQLGRSPADPRRPRQRVRPGDRAGVRHLERGAGRPLRRRCGRLGPTPGSTRRTVRELADAADKHRALLDEVTEPRLLHGDLWTVNVMLDRRRAGAHDHRGLRLRPDVLGRSAVRLVDLPGGRRPARSGTRSGRPTAHRRPIPCGR